MKTAQLKRKLDKLFSEYIRRRYADKEGYVSCVTCGVRKHWKEVDAGHYVSRSHLVTRFDERNVHVQCKSCNGFKGGRMTVYASYILKTYGEEVFEEFAKAPYIITPKYPYGAKIDEYKEKLKAL